jgi:hypothetical protein
MLVLRNLRRAIYGIGKILLDMSARISKINFVFL